ARAEAVEHAERPGGTAAQLQYAGALDRAGDGAAGDQLQHARRAGHLQSRPGARALDGTRVDEGAVDDLGAVTAAFDQPGIVERATVMQVNADPGSAEDRAEIRDRPARAQIDPEIAFDRAVVQDDAAAAEADRVAGQVADEPVIDDAAVGA